MTQPPSNDRHTPSKGSDDNVTRPGHQPTDHRSSDLAQRHTETGSHVAREKKGNPLKWLLPLLVALLLLALALWWMNREDDDSENENPAPTTTSQTVAPSTAPTR